ncbi:hypothetical protein Droror1_Dr00020624 [Drosera rotundifolia]
MKRRAGNYLGLDLGLEKRSKRGIEEQIDLIPLLFFKLGEALQSNQRLDDKMLGINGHKCNPQMCTVAQAFKIFLLQGLVVDWFGARRGDYKAVVRMVGAGNQFTLSSAIIAAKSLGEMFQGKYLKALFIGAGLVMFQQIAGQPSVLYCSASWYDIASTQVENC